MLSTTGVRLLRSAAASVLLNGMVIEAVAIKLERRVWEHTGELEARNRNLEGVVSAVLDLRDDPATLIRQTQELVLDLPPPGYTTYFEPVEGRYRGRVQTGDAGPRC
ncbi:hypothetical protein [Deinococcus sonorensis]|uniref:Uncharacterized protein n=2 Tax=Deinococcus sonorensis TaxID=309891 RepID=A0AAU7U7E1_9DEIO